MVQVASRTCIERKAAFATAGALTENGFHDYFNDLRILNSARGCTSVVESIGIVLDETRLHLRSCIYESPGLGNILNILRCADFEAELIPWFVREVWSRHIIGAVSDVHGTGLAVGGGFLLNMIGVREDGCAVLTEIRTSSRHIENTAR